MLGIGGGVIFLPALLFLIPAKNNVLHSTLVPIATSLFTGIFATVSSGIKHIIANNVCLREAFAISVASVISGFIFPKLAVKIDPTVLRYVISFLLLIVAVDMALKSDRPKKPALRLSKKYLLPAGFIAGIFSSITGLGGGIIIVPLLIYGFGLHTRKAIGTSVVIVAFTMMASALSYATAGDISNGNSGYLGYVNLTAGLIMGSSAVLGALLGVNINMNIKSERIKKIFSIFIFAVILKFMLS